MDIADTDNSKRIRIVTDSTDNSLVVQEVNYSTGMWIQNLFRVGIDGVIKNSSGYTVWHAGNDGSGSGLDADTVDGKHATDIVASGTYSDTTTVIAAGMTYTINIPVGAGKTKAQVAFNGASPANGRTYIGGLIICSTNYLDTVYFGSDPYGAFTSYLRTELGYVSTTILGSMIRCDECYLNGTNLTLVLRNTDTVSQTVAIDKLHWMAF